MTPKPDKKKRLDPKDPQVKMRVCLGPDCGKEFRSTHKNNRMCSKCKSVPKAAHWGSWEGEVVVDDLD